jgi:ubiquinone/menaquinone biosynthesis C-methylase UbiE
MNDSLDEPTRSRFDRMAESWDDNPVRLMLAKAVVHAIRQAVPLRPDMQAMDFGAGTGLVTLALSADVAGITAVDTSAEMLRTLESKLNEQGISNVLTLAGDIGSAPLPADRFDLIVSSMVLHHIADVPQLLHRLRPALRPGGWIALADLDTEDGTFHADPTGVYHRGLAREDVCRWLQEAGFTDARAVDAHRIKRPGADGAPHEYGVFLVTARIQ